MVIPEGFAQVNLMFVGTAAPTGAELTLGLENATDLSALAIAEAVEDACTASLFVSQATNALALTNIHVKRGPNETGSTADLGVSFVGGNGGAAVPPNVSMLISKLTSAGGRSGRGRWFMPGMSETKLDPSGNWDAVYVTDVTTDMGEFIASLVGDELNPVLLHGADSPVAIPTLITSMPAQAIAATQRRRLRR